MAYILNCSTARYFIYKSQYLLSIGNDWIYRRNRTIKTVLVFLPKFDKTILAVINIKNGFIFIVLVVHEVDALRKGRIEIYDRDL